MAAVDYYEDAAGGKAAADETVTATAAAALACRSELTPDGAKLLLVMVGLPSRGKSFISGKLHAFLSWSGYRTKIFNAGQHRRHAGPEKPPEVAPRATNSASDFFDTKNAAAKAQREQIAMETLDVLLEWLVREGDIAIFDATNTNVARRSAVVERMPCSVTGENIRVVYIESVCDDPAVLEANMRLKVRNSPDFRGLSEEEALADFRKRISHYEAAYETVQDSEGAYIKIYNLSAKVTAHQVYGRMTRSVLPYMMAIHNIQRSVFLVALCPRAGEQAFGRYKALGKAAGKGDDEIDCVDDSLCDMLMKWTQEHFDSRGLRSLCVLGSTKPSAVHAVEKLVTLGVKATNQSALNPLDRGSWQATGEDDDRHMAFTQRFPGGGESYQDLVRRLEPSLLDIERSVDPVLVISHVGPARALRTYFLGLDVTKTMLAPTKDDGATALAKKTTCVVELRPKVGGGWREVVHDLFKRAPALEEPFAKRARSESSVSGDRIKGQPATPSTDVGSEKGGSVSAETLSEGSPSLGPQAHPPVIVGAGIAAP